jgi:hypothetical protein
VTAGTQQRRASLDDVRLDAGDLDRRRLARPGQAAEPVEQLAHRDPRDPVRRAGRLEARRRAPAGVLPARAGRAVACADAVQPAQEPRRAGQAEARREPAAGPAVHPPASAPSPPRFVGGKRHHVEIVGRRPEGVALVGQRELGLGARAQVGRVRPDGDEDLRPCDAGSDGARLRPAVLRDGHVRQAPRKREA